MQQQQQPSQETLHAAQLLVDAVSVWSPEWTVCVELCVHVQARAFGFQVVNASQEASQEGECTPATSAAAADHLVRLLKDRAAVIAAEETPHAAAAATLITEQVLQESIASLHDAFFAQGPYKAWKAKSQVHVLDRELNKFIKSQSLRVGRSAAAAAAAGPSAAGRENGMHASSTAAAGFTGVADGPEWVLQLAQLALYFLLWTEAANLRHTPEVMWLLYHVCQSSNNFNKACSVLGSSDLSHYSLLRWLPPASANGRSSSTRGSMSSAAPTTPPQPSAQVEQLLSNSSNSSNTNTEALQQLLDDLECYEGVRRRGFVRGVLLPVRNALGSAARVGALLQEGPGPYNTAVAEGSNGVSALHEGCWWSDFPANDLAVRQVLGLNTFKMQPGVPPSQLGGGGAPSGACWSLAQLVLEDFAYFGDGCIFLDMVVQPIFNLMAEQIGLMGEVGESPALRLGYDDLNESACMPEVLSALVQDLSGEQFVDPWDGLLRRFNTSYAQVTSIWAQSNYADHAFKPVTPAMQQRYPRDPRRLEELAAKLRDAGAGGARGSAVLGGKWQRLQAEQQGAEGSAGGGGGAGQQQWVAPSTGGSMPVVHLHASLLVTDSLWAQLFKKTFIETRSTGAVAVAFSRVYILHAILLCWMSLLAYRVPDLSLSGSSSIFTGSFWQSNGLTVADCISWGVFLHAVLHVVKDLLLLSLLATPSAIRYRINSSNDSTQQPPPRRPVSLGARLRLWSAKHSLSSRRGAWQQEDRTEVVVQPPVHGGGWLKLHNIATLLFWLACAVVLLDSHIPSWPLNKLLAKALTKPGQAGPTMPVWGLISLVYVGLWVLHWALGLLADLLPAKASVVSRLFRKDSRRAAEHFFPYGGMSGSQNWPRFVKNTLLWAIVLLAKVLFDFFVVLQPLAKGAVRKLLGPLNSSTPWTLWAESVLAVWSLWVAASFLVFYDTGLFWQLISGIYSTLFLGMQRRIGHVKTWYDLVWAFPRLSYKFNQHMIPAHTPLLARTAQQSSSGGGSSSKATSGTAKDAAAASDAAAVIADNAAAAGTAKDGVSGGGRASEPGGGAAAPVRALQYVPLSPPSEVVFHSAWNQIVDDLRSRDLLSNAEASSLKYTHLGWGPDREAAWLLLPKFVTAGAAVEAVSQRGLTSKTQIEVIARSFNWLVWLLAALNMIKEQEVKALLLAPSKSQAAGAKGQGPRDASSDDLLAAAQVLIRSRELLETLSGKLKALDAPFCPLATTKDPTKRDINTQMLLSETLAAVLSLAHPKLDDAASAAIVARPPQTDLSDIKADPCSDLFAREREQPYIDAVKAAARLQAAKQDSGSSGSGGVGGGGAGASVVEEVEAAQFELQEAERALQEHVLKPRERRRQLLIQVVGWLLDMLKQTRGEAVPKSGEAVRALTFFATSLSNPYMPTAQPVALTRSMTTLTPHYGEGVIYALSESAANAEMRARCGSSGDDLVLLNDQEEPTETLDYLRIVYVRDWANFQERLFSRPEVKAALQRAKGAVADKSKATDIKEALFLPGQPLEPWCHELLSWASMRGQLLQRTVHGMMYYETALQQLILMQCRPQLTRLARRMYDQLAPSGGHQVGGLRAQNMPAGWADQVAEAAALLMARDKYNYVVSSQVLGELQLNKQVVQRWLSHSIRAVLSKRYPSLRIAYIDLENLGEMLPAAAGAGAAAAAAAGATRFAAAGPRNRDRGGKLYRLLRQYSVLLQYSQERKGVVELYRVRLPVNLETDRGIILGEGKPENQNHAVIFCHTETLQTIDSNQDGFLVEALKLPNLLAEFEYQDHTPINVRGSLRQQSTANRIGLAAKLGQKLKVPGSEVPVQGPALVGFREWVFSEDSGALAEFAAATERSFGTTVQRVMHNPGGCRFHYGHPDVWDKLFTMTNGGVSKATKSLHVSEDVFGGYNVMLRGRDIVYVDYVAVGKGRDMGFETINTFEAKIAAGNGEQVVSRDVSRLARRMNMPRLLSWYHTGNGFFINTSLLMYSMLVNAWLCLLLVLLSSRSRTNTTVLDDSLAVVGGLQLLQLGSLSVLVYIATVWLEDGFFTTMKNVLKQLVAGSIFFFVFRGQTSAAAFKSDLAYGGATYAATGRGYKLKTTPFIEVFMRYGRSHMWLGAHLLVLLIVAVSLGLKASLLAAWANILAILSLLAAPFWFNPFSLDWQVNKAAAGEWLEWMAGHKPASDGTGGKKLWRQYNEEQLRKATDDARLQLGRTARNILDMVFTFPSLIIICVAVYGMLDSFWGGIVVIFAVNALALLLTSCWAMATHLEAVKNAGVRSRTVKGVIKFVLAAGAIVLFAFMVDPGTRQKINLWRIFVRVLLVEFELARLSGRLLIAFLPQWQPARRLIDRMCWLADFALGLVLLLLLFVGSLFGLLTRYQAAVLFSMGYAAHYLAEVGLKHSEVGRLAKELKDLQRQERAAERSANPPQPDGPPAASSGGRPGTGGSGGGGGGGPRASSSTPSVSPQAQPWAALFSTPPGAAATASSPHQQHADADAGAGQASGSTTTAAPAFSGPTMSAVLSFLQGQQHQQQAVAPPAPASATSSRSNSGLPPNMPSQSPVAGVGGRSSTSASPSLSQVAVRPSSAGAAAEAALVASPQAAAGPGSGVSVSARGPPSEEELHAAAQRWGASPPPAQLSRVFQRSETNRSQWTEADYDSDAAVTSADDHAHALHGGVGAAVGASVGGGSGVYDGYSGDGGDDDFESADGGFMQEVVREASAAARASSTGGGGAAAPGALVGVGGVSQPPPGTGPNAA